MSETSPKGTVDMRPQKRLCLYCGSDFCKRLPAVNGRVITLRQTRPLVRERMRLDKQLRSRDSFRPPAAHGLSSASS
ncbi:hypothetical protein PoB_006732200 [Plakobranchus ocellatus]|uniref:Uncharacterized protein n=1 Tax=Plakobranchus ocellatus TaxID=259542 RepID=A0AAV4D990_9GAST|nr:hypothetical protein PoB_006732200 [Plakobranchus ocellatus]